MQKKLSFIKIYLPIVLFVATWWALAFKQSSNTPQISPLKKESITRSSFLIALTDRTSLQKALAGDVSLMYRLIADWDADAQIMQASNVPNIKRLASADFVHSQRIGRQLLLPNHQEDTENDLCFLPQTYAAASFLLALVEPRSIVALPKNLREQTQIYPISLTRQIALDIDRYNAEKLYLAKPDIAFVAHYSHPATVQALASQGIAIYTMRNHTDIADISAEIINIGNIIKRPMKAELLKLFIEAALISLDNQVAALTKVFEEADFHPRLLFLNHYQQYSIPSKRTLTGQLLARLEKIDISLKVINESRKKQEWMLPIDKEQILNINPDCLIVAAQNPKSLEFDFHQDPALRNLQSVRNSRLFFIDEAVQQTPSQYIVLAYYDLIEILSRLR